MRPWHWHPIFVHFTVALLVIASLLFIIAITNRDKLWSEKALSAARWDFWLGIAFAVVTLATGLLAFFTVPHGSGEVWGDMIAHMIAALVAATFYVLCAVWLWRRRTPLGNGWVGAMIIGLILLTITGYLGGDLVFGHGLGTGSIETAE